MNEEQIELAARYQLALIELKIEGRIEAQIIWDGMNDKRSTIFWALNIHNNTWPETSFANVLKKRVVLNRLKGKLT